MKRILLLILAFFLLPFYPLLKRLMRMGDKIHIGERIVVVTRNHGKRKILID